MTTSTYWIADTAISMPSPPPAQRPVVHTFEGTGFGLTTYGITVVISEADRDEMLSGYFGPPDGDPVRPVRIHPAPAVNQVTRPTTGTALPPPPVPPPPSRAYGEGLYGSGPYGGGENP